MPDRQIRVRSVGRYLPPTGVEFVSVEALSGLALLFASVAALVWANVAPGSYEELWTTVLRVGAGDAALSLDLRGWVNEGLMAVFFFVVGLEIKRELVRGELRNPRTASLPVVAALGGMVVPALLFTAVNAGGAGSPGWGIPMATDIAFAIVVLAILGARVPRPLKLFLLTLAIVDDIGAIIVIAFFYTDHLSALWLLGAVGAVGAVLLMQRMGAGNPVFYIVPALVMWVCMLESGTHATIAGVVLGLLTPARPFGEREVIERLEHRLHPWSSFAVVPLFALANAGVHLDATALREASGSAIALGIVVGLVVGKPLGIVTATALALRLRLGRLPAGVRMTHVLGAGAVAGIGFTVSLFVAQLSFRHERLVEAKVGIVAASLLSGLVGSLLVMALTAKARRPTESPEDR